MSLSPFGNKRWKSQAGRASPLNDATLRDFSSGLNLVDSDTALRSNWSTVLTNMHRDADGGMSLRWGTKFIFDVSSVVSGSILEIVDFRGAFICIMTSGEIAKVQLGTSPVVIWNEALANALVGTPSGWSNDLTVIDYTDFKNQLIICNGEDKPIIIDNDYTVDYLQDIPTGSNVYTPIGKFCTTVGNYVVIAGIVDNGSDIYISAAGASGTWPGDTAPNDAVSLNVATYAPEANSDIRGISSFRNFLLVHFAGLTIPLQLGTYDADGNHAPTVSDVIPDYGLLSHRFIHPLAQELVFADERGVYSAKRNLFGQALEGRFLSDKITPAYATATVDDSEDTGWVITQDSFCVHNRLEQRIMFFVKVGDRTDCFVFSFIDGLKKPAWSVFTGWDFTSGCTASDNKVYFAKGTKVYQYGNNVFEDEGYHADLINETDGDWADATGYVIGDLVTYADTVYECLINHTSSGFAADLDFGRWEEYSGVTIAFDWELPWSDLNARLSKKKVAFIHFDTQYTGSFTCSLFIDKIYKNKLTDAYDPALTLNFVGGDSDGFGGSGEQPFGGGRRTADERMWGFPLECKQLKFRIHGSTKGGLKFETISVLHTKGTYHR